MSGFNAEELFEEWASFVAKDKDKAASPKRRNLAALLRKIMAEAQSKDDGGRDSAIEHGGAAATSADSS
jgi:hypothetical protein